MSSELLPTSSYLSGKITLTISPHWTYSSMFFFPRCRYEHLSSILSPSFLVTLATGESNGESNKKHGLKPVNVWKYLKYKSCRLTCIFVKITWSCCLNSFQCVRFYHMEEWYHIMNKATPWLTAKNEVFSWYLQINQSYFRTSLWHLHPPLAC